MINTILGTAASEDILGTTGDDQFYGGGGADTMTGGAGNDTYAVYSAGAVVNESAGEGTDEIYAYVSYDISSLPNVENLWLVGGGTGTTATGNALANVISGNELNNTLLGGAGNDTLYGRIGNDCLDGGTGADSLYGGAGDDTYYYDNIGDVIVENAGEGSDVVYASVAGIVKANFANVESWQFTGSGGFSYTGTSGNDTYVGGNGKDTITGLAGNDTLDGADGDDTIDGGVGDDSLTGGAGNDCITGGTGIDTMVGGSGDDSFAVDDPNDVVVEFAGDGSDTIYSSVTYALPSGVENLTLTGTGNLAGNGNDLANILTGNAGNNILDGSAGDDTMIGGAGDDTYYIDSLLDFITEGVGGGTDTAYVVASLIPPIGAGWFANVESVIPIGAITGTPGNDLLNGDLIIPNINDTISGLGGDDTLNGLGGNDSLDGGAGNDSLTGGAGYNTLNGGLGNDTYVMDVAAPDKVVEDSLLGGGGTADRIEVNGTFSIADPIDPPIGNAAPGEFSEIEELFYAGTSGVTLRGNSLRNSLQSGSGNDCLVGGAGADTMTGGTGNDTYVIEGDNDVVNELAGGGTDQANSADDFFLTSTSEVENILLTGSQAASASGSNIANVITGNSADNALRGELGDDTLIGDAGDDLLDGGLGTDCLVGGAGNDTYSLDAITEVDGRIHTPDTVVETSGNGTDEIRVAASVDLTTLTAFENVTLLDPNSDNTTGTLSVGHFDVIGNALSNVLKGNSGNNLLDGKAGGDMLIGGKGNDTFVVDSSGDVLTENFSEGIDCVVSYLDSFTLADNFENLDVKGGQLSTGTGNNASNFISGNGMDNILKGLGGADTLEGSLGNDCLDGGFNRTFDQSGDLLIGGAGNDTYLIDSGGVSTQDSPRDVIDDQGLASDTDSAVLYPTYVVLTRATGKTGITFDVNPTNITFNLPTGGEDLDAGGGAEVFLGLDKFTSGDLNYQSWYVAPDPSSLTYLTGGRFYFDPNYFYALDDDIENLDTRAKALGINSAYGPSGPVFAYGNALNNYIVASTDYADPADDLGFGNYIDGQGGIDTLAGGRGSDTYVVDSASDLIVESQQEGTDVVRSNVTYDLATSDILNEWTAQTYSNVENLTLLDSKETIVAGRPVLTNLTGAALNIDGYGNSADNVLTGNTGNNRLEGRTGNDYLEGKGGTDTLVGGAGDDIYVLSDASDVILENPGEGRDGIASSVNIDITPYVNIENLFLGSGYFDRTRNDGLGGFFDMANLRGTGNSGDNAVVGNRGNNLIDGGGGNDTMIGDFGNDTLIGNTGNDSLVGGDGSDRFLGGAGDDTYADFNPTSESIVELAGEGTDLVQVAGDYTLGANIENATYVGLASVQLTGNELGNFLTGSAGSDTLNGRAGADTLVGGAGDDQYFVENAGDVITELAGEGFDVVNASSSFDMSLVSAEVLDFTTAGTAAVTGIGNTLDNVIIGSAGDNMLTGGGGNDTISGGAGNDSITADIGDDNLDGGTGNDTLDGLAGSDSLSGAAGNDLLTGTAGNDTLDGGTGDDTLDGGSDNDFYILDSVGDIVVADTGGLNDVVQTSVDITLSDAGTFSGIEDIELVLDAGNIAATGNSVANRIAGSDGDNALDGKVGNDVLLGGAGSDSLDGGVGADTLEGGTGNDTYVYSGDGDILTEFGGEGIDAIESAVTYTLGNNFEKLFLTGVGNIDGTGNEADNEIQGNAGDNSLVGGAGNDDLLGLGGNDTLVGGTGDDFYYVDSSSDVVTELASQGTDKVFSSAANYTLGANVEDLELDVTADISGTGNTLNNVITGNSGNNTLDGGAGTDTLDGGTGNDIYIVDSTLDTITDAAGTDEIQSSVDFSLLDPKVTGIEHLELTGPATKGTGNALANRITGNGLANTLDGGADNDCLIGGLGDDVYIVDSLADQITETAPGGIDEVQASVSYDLAAASKYLENLTLLEAAGASTGTGTIQNNIITGNSFANTLSGGDGDDSLIGNAGNDCLDGGRGEDTLVGGADDDIYIVGSEVVTIVEGVGAGDGTRDEVQAKATYTLGANLEILRLVGAAADNLNGSGNNASNELYGDAGKNQLRGFGGNDLLDGGAGNDTMFGGAGDDTYVFGVGDVISENSGQGTMDLVRTASTYTLSNNLEYLELLAGAGNINGTGNASNNYITGNEGDNLIDAGADLAGGTNTLVGGIGSDTLAAGVSSDSLDGGGDNDSLTGGGGNDTLLGGDGLDTITAGVGNDSVDGGAGADSLTGGGGNDTMFGGTENDTLVSGIGDDNLYGDDGADSISSGDGLNSLVGGAGDDTLVSGTGNDTLDGGADNDSLTAGDGNNSLSGEQGNDNLLAGTGADTLNGGEGNDTLNGGAGADLMDGGEGDDIYTVDNLGDSASEAVSGVDGGTDAVSSSVNFTLGSNIEYLTLTGAAANGTGNNIGNLIAGNGSANLLSGLGGSDTLDGGIGNDTLLGGDLYDSLVGGLGNDSLDGGKHDDFLLGTSAASVDAAEVDTLTGGVAGVADADVFILGDSTKAYYDNNLAASAGDYAVITDFSLTDNDQLQLKTFAEAGGNVNGYVIGGAGENFFGAGTGIANSWLYLDNALGGLGQVGVASNDDRLLAAIHSTDGTGAGGALQTTDLNTVGGFV